MQQLKDILDQICEFLKMEIIINHNKLGNKYKTKVYSKVIRLDVLDPIAVRWSFLVTVWCALEVVNQQNCTD